MNRSIHKENNSQHHTEAWYWEAVDTGTSKAIVNIGLIRVCTNVLHCSIQQLGLVQDCSPDCCCTDQQASQNESIHFLIENQTGSTYLERRHLRLWRSPSSRATLATEHMLQSCHTTAAAQEKDEKNDNSSNSSCARKISNE